MTHHDCLATLLAGPATGDPPRPPAGRQEEARAHAARCSDCWTVLALLHELAVGAPPADAERMPALYGCGPVQEDIYLLAGLTAAEMRALHPERARHLGWCLACRDRLGEVLLVERAAARGEFEPGRRAAARMAETIHEAVGRMVVQVRRAAVSFAAVPDGFALVPLAVPAGAYRGDAAATAPGQLCRFALPESPLSAELTLEPRHDERVGVTLRFSGGDAGHLSVHLHELHGARPALVARHPVRGADPVVFRGLDAGRYVLEIRERERARRFRVRVDIERPV